MDEPIGPTAKRTGARDPRSMIAGLARDGVCLELNTVDLCFLAALTLRGQQAGVTSFEEDEVLDIYEQTCNIVDIAAEFSLKGATHSIQRLRDQRMLSRVDFSGISRAADYSLTRLAASIMEFYLNDEALTRESLTLLTTALRVQLATVLSDAKRAGADDEVWLATVIQPLNVTVADMVKGIDQRQRGLDSQQEDIQKEIAELLQEGWFGAVEHCQTLLDTTTETLRELNEVLMQETTQLITLLQDIQTEAMTAGNSDAELTVQRVIEHVDGITAWGSARQRAWSDYYQYVHRYLRDVVRLDPDRALSQRLRNQIATWPSRPFHFRVADSPSIRLLRPLEARVERPPVVRPHADREAVLEVVMPEDAIALLDDLVRAALAAGAMDLATVTAQILPELPANTHYAAIGRIADAVARLSRVRSAHERPWRQVSEHLEIEDWTISGGDTI